MRNKHLRATDPIHCDFTLLIPKQVSQDLGSFTSVRKYLNLPLSLLWTNVETGLGRKGRENTLSLISRKYQNKAGEAASGPSSKDCDQADTSQNTCPSASAKLA